MKPINFLVDCYHPASYLILKNVIKRLVSEGHTARWCIRDKDVLADLMRDDGEPFEVLTTPRTGLVGQASELIEHNLKILKRLWKYKIDVALGPLSVSVAQAAILSKARSVIFNDDDQKVVPQFVRLAYPLANWIVTPECLPETHGFRHVKHPSYHVLAYLHPNHFQPDIGILGQLGVAPTDSIFVLRFVSLKAFHDTHAKGLPFSAKIKLIEKLSSLGKVIISCEGDVPKEFERYRFRLKTNQMHSLLAFSTLVISDSQTVTAEAAVLGVPSLRCNTFVGQLAYLEELEHRYELTYGYKPDAIAELFAKLETLLAEKDLKLIWQNRRRRMLEERIDLAQWIYTFLMNSIIQKP